MAEQETSVAESTPVSRFRRYHLNYVLPALAITLLLRAFLFEAVAVPSSSMEGTLLPGDFILCYKAGYALHPQFVTPLFGLNIPLPQLFSRKEVRRGSIVVFSGESDDYSGGFRKNEFYIKRVTGIPGDTLLINGTVLSINGVPETPPPAIKHNEKMFFKGDPAPGIFPSSALWNEDYYGPVVIPGTGITVPVNDSTLELYSSVILRELPGASLYNGTLNYGGKNLNSYTFKENYYFVMGDNRNNSRDSRYSGFVSRAAIIASPLFVYLSIDADSPSLSGRVRFSRTGKGIQ